MPEACILLVEDNPHIMEINALALEDAGFEIIRADTVKRCRELLGFYDVDLAVLDIMLPDGDGLELCREIKSKYRLPILFLSALGENPDIVKGLSTGGDDYLPKPYDLDVLIARVNALLRSSRYVGRFISFGGLSMNILTGSASIDGRSLQLTQKEFALLACLAKSRVELDANNLCERVWGQPGSDSLNALRLTISRLKQKLMGSSVMISSKRGAGYLLEEVRTRPF